VVRSVAQVTAQAQVLNADPLTARLARPAVGGDQCPLTLRGEDGQQAQFVSRLPSNQKTSKIVFVDERYTSVEAIKEHYGTKRQNDHERTDEVAAMYLWKISTTTPGRRSKRASGNG